MEVDLKDITGKTFGRWTVESYEGDGRWRVKCICGGTTALPSNKLTSGRSRSCGCLRSEVTAKRNRQYAGVWKTRKTHGMQNTKEYRSWAHAKGRCFTPTDAKYPDYGGRGITMCEEWR